ncbi:MAG: cation:proton antiporter [Rhodanobacteraceae bacterium]
MSFVAWMAAIGALLLTMSLISGWIRRLPITTYAVYMLVGFAVSPAALDLVRIDIVDDANWLARLTQVTLIVSLFIGGLKLRIPFRDPSWRCALRLASIAMILCIGGVAVAMHVLFGLPWALSLIVGAALAPTDPVLTTTVSVDNASDRDALRVALSGEAGFNDGAALPFLTLGLAAVAAGFAWPSTLHWLAIDALWAIGAGFCIGYALGWGVGRAIAALETRRWTTVSTDLLALALMLLAYAAADTAHALGFIAAFAAGLGLRGAEKAIVRRQTDAIDDNDEAAALRAPAETLVLKYADGTSADDVPPRAALEVGKVVFGALSFGDTLERLLGTLIMLLLGALLADNWNLTGLAVAALLFVLIRPLSVALATPGLGIPWQRRALIGWLGIRGIGSLNYLAYALAHGLAGGPHARLIAGIVVTCVGTSVVAHGVSAEPLLAWRRRRLEAMGAVR